jgi:transcriptional antiterminator RfaH
LLDQKNTIGNVVNLEKPVTNLGGYRGAAALSFSNRREFKLPQWFCIQTKPGRESMVVQSLRKLPAETHKEIGDLNIYFPQIRVKMLVGGFPRVVRKPLFPKYFFTRFLWEKAFRFMDSRPEAIGIVRYGEFPGIIPAAAIEELQTSAQDFDLEIVDPVERWEAGQRVLITCGPFKGMEAEFVRRLKDTDRVSLLLQYLQTYVSLSMSSTDLKALN